MFAPCAVIPVYNHEHTIRAVVEGIRAHGVPVLLVDDGSHAACAEELRQLSELPEVSLLRHPENRGKGAAVCTGLREANARGFTHALQIDADGQHRLADLRRFIEQAHEHPDCMVCGRPVFDASMPRSRYYGRYLTHGLVWLETLSFEIIDSMCGFRVYPLAAVITLIDRHPLGSRMDFDVEILVRLHWREVPVRWIATRVSYPFDGVSHYRLFADNILMVGLHARLLAGMLLRLPLLMWRKLARRGPAGQQQKGDVNV